MSFTARVVDQADDAQMRAFYEVMNTGLSHGRPHFEVYPWESWLEDMRGPRSTGDWELIAACEEGRIVGIVEVWFHVLDNLDKFYVYPAVPPQHRRRGVGSFLVETALASPVVAGRSCAIALCPTPPGSGPDHPYVRFALSQGFEVSHVDVRRLLRLPVPPERLAGLDSANRPRWEGRYRIVTSTGLIPDEYVEGYCAAYNRVVVDAPTGLIAYEPELLTPEIVRASDAARQGSGFTRVLAVAVSPDGEVAGYCEMMVVAGSDQVQQADTIVVSEHRRSGLGMGLKLAALRRAVEVAPSSTEVMTANGEANPWMVRINEQLGFVPVDQDVMVVRRV